MVIRKRPPFCLNKCVNNGKCQVMNLVAVIVWCGNETLSLSLKKNSSKYNSVDSLARITWVCTSVHIQFIFVLSQRFGVSLEFMNTSKYELFIYSDKIEDFMYECQERSKHYVNVNSSLSTYTKQRKAPKVDMFWFHFRANENFKQRIMFSNRLLLFSRRISPSSFLQRSKFLGSIETPQRNIGHG